MNEKGTDFSSFSVELELATLAYKAVTQESQVLIRYYVRG